MKDYKTSLLCISTGEMVPAIVKFGFTIDYVAKVEMQWKSVRKRVAKSLLEMGKSRQEVKRVFQHSHWDWLKKASLSSEEDDLFVSIECENETQGMMLVNLESPHFSYNKDDLGKPLIYVGFIESAPWNLEKLFKEPKFKLVGFRLIQAAIRTSIEKDFKGRVGLFSLQQSEYFYKGLGMLAGPTHPKDDLRWYELTSDGAQELLNEE